MNEKKLIIDTFEELSPRYEEVVDAELNLFWGFRYNEFVDTLLKMTTIREQDRVLDIATGTGVIPTKISTEKSRFSETSAWRAPRRWKCPTQTTLLIWSFVGWRHTT
ncbi:MAG: hypothetical protein P8Y72_16045 [Anaerolineales bacterium]